MQKQILSSLLFTMTVATHTAEKPTQEENKQVVHHIIFRGYPQKNYAPKSPAELIEGIVMNNTKTSPSESSQKISLKNLKKSPLFTVDQPSKL